MQVHRAPFRILLGRRLLLRRFFQDTGEGFLASEYAQVVRLYHGVQTTFGCYSAGTNRSRLPGALGLEMTLILAASPDLDATVDRLASLILVRTYSGGREVDGKVDIGSFHVTICRTALINQIPGPAPSLTGHWPAPRLCLPHLVRVTN
jgi:hypothetical protein